MLYFFFFFLFSFPFIRFVSREEASCCQGGRPRGAAGKIKGGGSACRTVDREKKHFFFSHMAASYHVLTAMVSRAGAALRLRTLETVSCLSHKHGRATRQSLEQGK